MSRGYHAGFTRDMRKDRVRTYAGFTRDSRGIHAGYRTDAYGYRTDIVRISYKWLKTNPFIADARCDCAGYSYFIYPYHRPPTPPPEGGWRKGLIWDVRGCHADITRVSYGYRKDIVRIT